MATVLAVIPESASGQSLDELSREFPGHEVVVVRSTRQLAAAVGQRGPDLVLFPLTLAAPEQQALATFLSRWDPGSDGTGVSFSTPKAMGSATLDHRWFYWLRPAGKPSSPQPTGQSVEEPAEALSRRHARPGASIAQSSAATLHRGIATFPKFWRAILSLVAAAASLAAKMCARLFRVAGASGSQTATWTAHAFAAVGRQLARVGRGLVPVAVVCLKRAFAAALIAWRAFGRMVQFGASWLRRTATGLWSVRSTALKLATAALVIASAVGLVGGASRILWRSARPEAATVQEVAQPADAQAVQDTPAEPVLKGRLSIASDPSRAAVLVDGERRGFTPIEIDDLTAGQHVVTLEQAAGSVRKVVKVKANETTTLDVPVLSGWLALTAPFELQVWDEGRALRLDARNRVMLSAGQHDLLFMNRALGYRSSRVVTVLPGESTAVSLAPPKTPVTVTASVPSEVWIDGVHVGQTPLIDQPVGIGTREILCRNPTFGDRRVTATVTTRPLRIKVDFSKPEA